MNLPHLRFSLVWPPFNATTIVWPIKKLLSNDYTTGPRDMAIRKPTFWRVNAAHNRCPIHRPRLDLSHFLLLEEFTVTYMRADKLWFLDTYAVQGPDMNSVALENCYWHAPPLDFYSAEGGTSVYDPSCEGAAYYQSKEIEVDSGLRWLVDEEEDPVDTIWPIARERSMPRRLRMRVGLNQAGVWMVSPSSVMRLSLPLLYRPLLGIFALRLASAGTTRRTQPPAAACGLASATSLMSTRLLSSFRPSHGTRSKTLSTLPKTMAIRAAIIRRWS